MSERTLITGATGFVGGLLAARLVAEGRQVRALVRNPGDRERLPDPRVELAIGHLDDEESLARAADGCQVVYHVAGVNQLCLADPTPLYRANVEGTQRMLEAARRAGVRRVVHTSSAATLGGDGSSFLDETAGPPSEFTSHYARSKWEGEQVALGFDAVEVVVVNPSSVQGPGRTTGTAGVFIGYLNGRLPFDLPARFGLCYTLDCVNGHLLAEAKGRPGQRYVLNTDTLTNSEAIDLIAVISGLTDTPRTLPLPLAMGAAAVAEAVGRVRGRQPKLCRESVRTLGHPHLYDGSRATRELGLHYTPVRQALEATVRWYVQQGLVTRKLPRIATDAPAPEPAAPDTPDGTGASLFEPPPGRQREWSP
jgi:dihydroflavonol-4-reductase